MTWSNNTAEGTAGILITGKGNYTGTLTGQFTICSPQPSDVTADIVVGSSDGTIQTYDISSFLPATGTNTITKNNQTGAFLNTVAYGNGKIQFSINTAGVNAAKPGDTGLIQFRVENSGKSFFITLNISIYDDTLKGTATIDGTSFVGYTLTAKVTDSNALGDLTYQWMRGGAVIEGATRQNYQLTPEDANREISVRVSDSEHSGSLTASAGTVSENAFSAVYPYGYFSLKADAKAGYTVIVAGYDNAGRLTGTASYVFTRAARNGTVPVPEGKWTTLRFFLLTSQNVPVCEARTW